MADSTSPSQRGGFLSATDRAALDRFPDDVDPDSLRHDFTITDLDLDDVVNRRYGAPARLAAGLQIGALRLLGFVPTDLTTAPKLLIAHVAGQVDAAPNDLAGYTERTKTRHEHIAAVERHIGLRRAGRGDLKVLGDWLVERALEHDHPMALFRLGCEFLRNEGLVRPGATTVERAVVAARIRATEETHRRIAPQLVGLRDALDELLIVDSDLDLTPLVWLRRPGSTENAATIKEQLAKIERLHQVGAAEIDLSTLNPNRVRHLAAIGRRMKPQAIARLDPQRRHQILAATVVETYTERIDEVLDLFDLAIAGIEHNARVEHSNRLGANATTAEETVRVFSTVAGIVLDNEIPDDRVRSRILDEVGADSFAVATANAARIVRPHPGHLDLVIGRYSRVRAFAPHVLEAFRFHGPDSGDPLLRSVHLLAELNATGRRRPPDNAPTSFATRNWRRLIINNDGSLDRHAWELAVLIELRGALRGANIWVGHSRRYRNPTNYLLPDHDWQRLRPETNTVTDVSLDCATRIGDLTQEMNEHLAGLEVALDDASSVRIDEGKLVVTPLPKQEAPADLEPTRNTIDSLLPQIDLIDLLVEVNEWCGFLERLTHVDNATDRSGDLTERLLASIVAHGCNFGIDKMARISGFTPDQLAWTNNWYLRTSTVREANDNIVNHQHGQPIAQSWGDGTLSSSEHTTDTAGYTDLVFGLFDLTGLRFSPRIRDIADQRLWRLPDSTTSGPAASLLEHTIRTERIEARWDDMLRVAATIRHGYLPASLLISKLQASARQNQLTQALQEYGRIIKTNSILRYLHNPEHRRRIHNQLNKGESLHALRRALLFANLGRLRHRNPDDQDLQGECLTLLTNAIVCWNTVHTQAAIRHLEESAPVVDDIVAQLSPNSHEHINFHGRYDFHNLTAPAPGELRPLRNRPISSI